MIEKKPKGNILWTGGGDDGGDGGEGDELLEEIKVSVGLFVISWGGGEAPLCGYLSPMPHEQLCLTFFFCLSVDAPIIASHDGGGAVRKLHLRNSIQY